MRNPTGFEWSDFGAYVGAPGSAVFTKLSPHALKVVQGRFHVVKPSDDVTWAWFPYSDLVQYEMQEVEAGRPPIFVKATYRGKRRPVYWSWSLGLRDRKPTSSPQDWEQAVNVQDDRFIRFWYEQYVRGTLSRKQLTPLTADYWIGLDECAFNWGLYGVIDDSGDFVAGVPWDPPFPGNEDEYLNSVMAFFRKLKQIAPNLRVMTNVGSLRDWTRFSSVFAEVPGLMLEDIYDPNGALYARNSKYGLFSGLSWFGSQGRIGILRAMVGPNLVQIRTAATTYLLLKGPNFFFAPQYVTLFPRFHCRLTQ